MLHRLRLATGEYDAFLSEWVQRLRNTSGPLNPALSADANTRAQTRYLIDSTCLAEDLRSDSSLKSVLKRVCRLIFCQEFATQVVEALDAGKVFDQSELSRGRLTVDVAHMLVWRARNTSEMSQGDGMARYLLIDSSPQYGSDYELLLVKQIKIASLSALWRVTSELLRLWTSAEGMSAAGLDERQRAD